MKKILGIGIILLIMLVGCSDKEKVTEATSKEKDLTLSDELDDFIDKFNKEVKNLNDNEEDLPDIEAISKDDIREIKGKDEDYSQSLLEVKFGKDKGYYAIFAVYNSYEELTGYRLFTQGPEDIGGDYVALDDRAMLSSAVLADSLDLGIEEYYEEINSLINANEESGSYEGAGYEIDFKIHPETNAVTVNYVKEQVVEEETDKEPESERNNENLSSEDDETDKDDETVDDLKFDRDHDMVSIEQEVKSLVSEYQTTSINDIKVNDDMGTGEGYIVLVYLSFDAMNKQGTAKEMIDMYSNDLGGNLASEEDVNEVTVFWEVPYLHEGDNVAKYNMQRSGGGMAIKEKWFEPDIFK